MTESTRKKAKLVHIQSQARVQAYGVLRFPFASATSTLDAVHVRVTKPDKALAQTPLDSILEMPSEITREAPFYSDIKEKQIPVKGLEVGDVLEYE
jgi:hypothetical protein